MYMYKFKTLNADSKTLNEDGPLCTCALYLLHDNEYVANNHKIKGNDILVFYNFTILCPFKYMSFLTFWESLGNFESIMVQPISVY